VYLYIYIALVRVMTNPFVRQEEQRASLLYYIQNKS
jgi:hypothetical protein